ncbi:Gnk2-homologous domain [Sesbania bispinosa]|nr:Gnk2-homologous domain [Sesbania bispinosa]
MVITKTNFSLLIFATVIVLSLSFSSSSTDLFLYGGCTQQRYNPNSPYEFNLNSLLTSLVNSATYSSYNNFTVVGSSANDVVYGLYQCRGDLSMPDCATCVSRAVTRSGEICPATCGGVIQLDGCYVKLAGSGGYFRVGGSGRLKGVAQCTGDLSFAECQDCVAEAIRRLRSDCPAADYGDMFLAKCYARYSTGGAHAYSKAHGKSDDEGEKTFAIIIGLLAGVAVLIIFLAFLRRICEGQGK